MKKWRKPENNYAKALEQLEKMRVKIVELEKEYTMVDLGKKMQSSSQ